MIHSKLKEPTFKSQNIGFYSLTQLYQRVTKLFFLFVFFWGEGHLILLKGHNIDFYGRITEIISELSRQTVG